MRIKRSVAGRAGKCASLARGISVFGLAVLAGQPDRVLQSIPQPHAFLIFRIVVPCDRVKQISLPVFAGRTLPSVNLPRPALPLLARFVRRVPALRDQDGLPIPTVVMPGLQLSDHAIFPPPYFVPDAVAHGFFLKVGNVCAACKEHHMRKEDCRLA